MNATSTHSVIAAIAKPKSGKGAARELRRNGYLPAVIYKKGEDSQSIAIKATDLAASLRKGHFFTHNHELSLDGKAVKVLARDIQRDPVTDLPLHVDFIPYNPKSIVHVNVTVRLEGEELSPGIKIGGVLQLIETQIEVICRADSIPEELVVSVAELEIGDSVHLSNIKLPEGVKPAVTDRDLTIASVVSTRASNIADEAADAAATAEAAPAAEAPKAE
ncbi:MAG: 50S ribosomal protein L25/general stress protein Ctc [Blastochloris viridis]|uniref:Large ribosomal subunit protein bL25 n=1 Tax=Blastochloris viridis TaxID=1079 RepID=A0A6N4RAX7_BLAVI|nr:MAG: 50S ribosomal protein L25/general stress protein Ctc [Blastochloris viridis]